MSQPKLTESFHVPGHPEMFVGGPGEGAFYDNCEPAPTKAPFTWAGVPVTFPKQETQPAAPTAKPEIPCF